jgi:hypothetical protein
MIVMGVRRPMIEDVCEEAALHVPKVWAHRRAMLQFHKMGALDQESFRMMTQTMGAGWKNLKWVSCIPTSVAAVLNHASKGELFNDTTGKTMLRFLARNPQYKPPKGSPRVSVSVP